MFLLGVKPLRGYVGLNGFLRQAGLFFGGIVVGVYSEGAGINGVAFRNSFPECIDEFFVVLPEAGVMRWLFT
jgi:hypothetical protein